MLPLESLLKSGVSNVSQFSLNIIPFRLFIRRSKINNLKLHCHNKLSYCKVKSKYILWGSPVCRNISKAWSCHALVRLKCKGQTMWVSCRHGICHVCMSIIWVEKKFLGCNLALNIWCLVINSLLMLL